MDRVREPELMDDPEQALAYARADFSATHGARVPMYRELFPEPLTGPVLDLGCGSGDVLLRFARAFPQARFVGIDVAAIVIGYVILLAAMVTGVAILGALPIITFDPAAVLRSFSLAMGGALMWYASPVIP